MAHMFCPHFLRRKMDKESFEKLESYLNTGKPHLSSTNDGYSPGCDVLKPIETSIKAEYKVTDSDQLFAMRVFEDIQVNDIEDTRGAFESELKGYEDIDCDYFANLNGIFEKENAWRNERLRRSSMLDIVNKRRIRERGPWSPEEDRKLLEAYKRYGGQWRKLSRMLKIGTDDRLRNRWDRMREGVASAPRDVVEEVIRLTSRVSKRPYRWRSRSSNLTRRMKWDAEEDDVIIAALKDYDPTKRPSWKKIAKAVEGRTPHAIRNRASRLIELGRVQPCKL